MGEPGWISIAVVILQTIIAAVLAAFSSAIRQNKATLDTMNDKLGSLAVSMARMSSTYDGFEKRFEQFVRDTERRLGMLEEHMLLVRQDERGHKYE